MLDFLSAHLAGSLRLSPPAASIEVLLTSLCLGQAELQKMPVETISSRSLHTVLGGVGCGSDPRPPASPKGGVDDEISLTAYITAALLEMGKTVNVSSQSPCLVCP